MIISILKLKPRPDQREPMLDIFRTVISLTNGRPGCMGCSTQEEDSSQWPIIYIEQWESKEAMERHIQSSIYGMILNAMELAAEAPEIRFHEITNTMGLEFIAALRAKQNHNEYYFNV